jgi:6-phosphogluconolactonase (cycloisomerase 2 family)
MKTMIKRERELCRRPHFVLLLFALTVALLVGPSALVLNASANAESETLGKLEYIDHITRKDLFCVTSIETSPDGEFAYAAAYNAFALTVFKRDKETGSLEHVQTTSDRENLNGVVSARVSPNGSYVVCTAFRSNTVSLFERDWSKGTLKMLDIVKQGNRGGEGLTWVIDSAFSPDSKFIYTIADLGRGQKAGLSVFRITDERKLQLVQESVQTDVGEHKYLLGARGIAISPEGDSVYVASYKASTLVVLDRDAKSGKTALRQIIEDEKGDVHGLGGAFAVTCSADGKFVYTSAPRWEGDNAICVFKKTADGTLSLVQEIFDGKDGVTGFVGGNELRVSRDGRNVYALGSQSNSVVVFRRDVETGKLAYLQTVYDSEVVGREGSASGIEISPDSEHVYVAGESDSSIVIFKRLIGTKSSSLIGTWELASYKYGDQKEFSDYPKNRRRIKMITDTHFLWFELDTSTKEIQIGAGGSYSFIDDTYIESQDFSGEGMKAYAGTKHTFTVRVEGDKFIQSGGLSSGLKIEEVWHRLK